MGKILNVGSLFSGIGGMEIGFEKEGFTTSWFVENNEYCKAVLRKHFPGKPIYGDIKTVDFKEIEHVDILVGGFPCQDISIAGKRKGMAGERSGLWSEFSRAIGEIRPRYVVVENVPNLLNLGIEKVLADISQAGYDCEWFTLRASDFGAIHRRERIFIIAYSTSQRCDGGDDKSRENSSFEEWTSEENIESRNRRINGLGENASIHASNSTGERQRGRGSKEPWNKEDASKVSRRSSPRFFADDWSQRVQRFREETLQGEFGLSWCKDIRGIEDFKGRSDIPEPLVRRSDNGFSGGLDRIERTRAIGNAVVPQVAQFIARQVKEKEGLV